MPEPLTIAAVFAFSYLLKFAEREAMSAASDKIKKRPRQLSAIEPVKKAADKTLEAFPTLKKHDLRFVLEMWCNSGKFERIYKGYQRDQQSASDELILVGFRDTAQGYNASGEVAAQAHNVLMTFFEALHWSLLQASKEGLAYHDSLEAQRFAELKSQLSESQGAFDRVTVTNERLVEAIARLTLEAPVAPPAPGTPDDKWKADVERALKWSESGDLRKIEGAKSLIVEVREDADFEQLSPVMRARLATAATVCAVEVGDHETAKTEVEEALRLHPENVACISNAAGVAVMRDEFAEAIVLAQRAREKEPRNENAALVLVQSWHHTGKLEQVEEFLRENPWFFDLPHGLSVLAQLRRREGRYDETIRLAKRALKRNRQDVQALEEIFDVLFYPLRDKVWSSSEWDYGPRTRRKLKRAEAAINRAIGILEKGANTVKLHRALSNRASVRSAQEKTQQALGDCDRVLHTSPTPENRDLVSLNKALILMHVGRAPEALPLLESLQDERRRDEGAFSLAYAYHVVGQHDRAVQIWEKLWKPSECDSSQMMTAELLLWVYRQQKNDEASESVLKRAREACPDNPEVTALVAQDKFDCGDADGAVALLQEAAETCRERGDERSRARMMLRIGGICYRVDKLKEAAQAWREVGWTRLLPPYRGPYLSALYRANEYKDALEVARRIREESGFVPRAAEIEAAVCAYMSDWDVARELWEELSRREPNNPLHPFNRALAALQAEDDETARRALQEISLESIKNSADLLRRVSQMQAHLGLKNAIRFAFRARQIDFGNPKSHNNYVQVFVQSTNAHNYDERGTYSDTHAADVLGLNGPQWGEVPCTIRLMPVGSDNEKERLSYTILNEGPFDLARKIYPANDEFAQRLLAFRSRQDTIEFRETPTGPAQEYHVAELQNPLVHAFQESLAEAYKWFGDAGGLWTIDVSENFDAFFSFMNSHNEGFEEVIKTYSEWRFPLCTVGNLRSRSVFDLWFLVAQRPQWGIHAERGATEVFDKAIEKLAAHFDETQNGKPALVLESTALLALVHLGFADIITPHFHFLVPKSLRQKIKQEVGETHAPHIPNGVFDRLLEFVDGQAKVLPAKSIIEFSPEDIQQWQQCIGKEELDALLLAREHGALAWADDTLLREMGRFHPGVESINTQHILAFLERRGLLSQEVRYECLETMAQHNFKHMLLSAHFFVWLAGKHSNKTNHSMRVAFHYLEAPTCNDNGALKIAATLIAKVYSLPEPQPFDVLDLCLLALTTGRPISSSLEQLQFLLCQPHFGLRENIEMLRTLLFHIELYKRIMLGRL